MELSQDKKSVDASLTLGEQAHIVGDKEDAARGKSTLTDEERNTYHNIIYYVLLIILKLIRIQRIGLLSDCT